jgi:hypothetical protein
LLIALAQLRSQSTIALIRIDLALILSACVAAFAQAKPHSILQKVVVPLFKAGADTGRQPGGLRSRVERDGCGSFRFATITRIYNRIDSGAVCRTGSDAGDNDAVMS